MGKAFSDAERAQVQEKLRRTGLRLFAEQGIKKLSIRALAREAGIAQGEFYAFYSSKEDFILDLMQLRITEKLALTEEKRDASLGAPVEFLTDMFYREGMHLKENKAFNNGISDSLRFFMEADEARRGQMSQLYRSFFERMVTYWRAQGYRVTVDLDGLINAILAAGILFSNAEHMDAGYFSVIYRAFCQSAVQAFLKVEMCDA